MIAKRILIIGITLATSCIILAGTAWIYIAKESQREIDERADELSTTTTSASQLIDATCNTILSEAGSQLVAMHEEGLSFQMSRWKNNNPLINHIFTWTPENGFSSEFKNENDPPVSNLVWLDQENTPSPPSYRSSQYGDPSSFNWDIGYFQENLDNTRYSGHTPRPTMTWHPLESGTDLQWICWHRLHDKGTIRGFTLNTQELITRLHSVAQSITPPHLTTTLTPQPNNDPIQTLPGWTLNTRFKEESSLTQSLPFLSQILIVISLTLALASGILIIQISNKKHREALKKTNFVALVSHELKTPLTSISMYAELIDNPELTADKQHKFATTISRQSDRLRSMIDNLLTLSSIEKSNNRPRLKKVDLAELTKELSTDLQLKLQESFIQLKLLNHNDQFIVKGDEDSIRRVFINLIDNAAKYAKDGKFIEIEFIPHPDNPKVAIRDHGPGIPSNKAETIFKPFSQLNDKLTDKSPGIGIGLSISRNLIREIGGNLHLDTSYKQGTAFILTFNS